MYDRRMARLSSEILGLNSYRGSVFQLVKVGPIMLKSSEYDPLRLKVNSFVTSIHIFWVLESTVFL